MITDPSALPSPLGVIVWLIVPMALVAALVLTLAVRRRPRTGPLATAGVLLVLATVLAALIPLPPEVAGFAWIIGVPLVLAGVTLAAWGGNPITHHVLDLATGGRVRETPDGGILLPSRRPNDPTEPLLRGGTTIGYLERTGAVLAIIAGFPEAIAVLVAVKGIGRFSELAAPEARERFIIGTLASLLWAGATGAAIRLALW